MLKIYNRVFNKLFKNKESEYISSLEEEVKQLKKEKKEMVELLGRVYYDVITSNDRIFYDTKNELMRWVNK